MLRISNIKISYGHVSVLNGLSLDVHAGGIVSLLGGNGCGKTTTLKAIMGLIHPAEGSIEYEGQAIHHLRPAQIVSRGIALVPQGRRIFSDLTVIENLKMGTLARRDRRNIRNEIRGILARFTRLAERRKQKGGTLSVGEQQLVAFGRGLMSRPKLLLMDEPSAGLAPRLVEKMFRIIQEINRSGTTILLVEQNVHMALSLSQYGYILRDGKIALADESKNLINNEDVVRSYLGE
ncbi:MAG: ABC transporter ATP-binding protein [Desulfobacterales bacterium]|nr:MAG: ABC transporter ATP-binding protein [Desulfobacterales bacterium]